MNVARDRVRNILTKLNITKPPVHLDKVVELFSVKVVPYTGFPDNISGMIIKDNDVFVIGVNENKKQSKNRIRFTIAHELGHFLMGHDEPEIIDETFDSPSSKEKDANQFAAELLIPIDFLKKDIEESKEKYNIPSLATRYEVSEQAISIRLLETGLIRKL